MKKRNVALFISSMLTVVVAYHMYKVRIPDGFQDPWSLRAFLCPISIFISLSDIGEQIVGGEFKLQFLQFIVRAPYVPHIRQFLGDGSVKMIESDFDGVPVRLYIPVTQAASAPSGGIIFIHGGGWTMCNLDTHDWLTRKLADDLQVVVASVEYRLAPDFPFPIPLEDSVKAAKYFLNNTDKFNVDPQRVAIVGDSAGGNLATAVSMILRDTNFHPRPKLQVLLYPALQAVDFHTPSYHIERHGTITNWRNMVQFWLSYARGSLRQLDDVMHSRHVNKDVILNVTSQFINYANLPSSFIPKEFSTTEMGSHSSDSNIMELEEIVTDPYFSPLLANDLSNMPDTFIMTVEHDVLRDEGAMYAHRLRLADNKVEYEHIAAGLHGLVSFHWFADARDAFEKVINYIERNL